jgi:type I restriction enzyme R subunit
VAQAIAVMLEKQGVAWDMMHGSDGVSVVDDPKKAFLALPALQQHILEQEDGKKRWVQVVRRGHIRIARSRCGG